MFKMTPTRRSRGHAAIANAVSLDVRAQRAAAIAEMDRKRQLEAAESEVARVRAAFERARDLSEEQAALDAATARLEELSGKGNAAVAKAKQKAA